MNSSRSSNTLSEQASSSISKSCQSSNTAVAKIHSIISCLKIPRGQSFIVICMPQLTQWHAGDVTEDQQLQHIQEQVIYPLCRVCRTLINTSDPNLLMTRILHTFLWY